MVMTRWEQKYKYDNLYIIYPIIKNWIYDYQITYECFKLLNLVKNNYEVILYFKDIKDLKDIILCCIPLSVKTKLLYYLEDDDYTIESIGILNIRNKLKIKFFIDADETIYHYLFIINEENILKFLKNILENVEHKTILNNNLV